MIERAWLAARRPGRVALLGLATMLALPLDSAQLRLSGEQQPPTGEIALRATRHDPVPSRTTEYWLSPAPGSAVTPALRDFARAAVLVDTGGDAASAAPLLAASALDATPLGNHVRYYRGLVALRQARVDEAVTILSAVAAAAPPSYATEQALVRLAEAHELRGQYRLAAEAYARALKGKPADADWLTHRWAVALERGGDPAASVLAHRIVYYDFPLSADASESGKALDRLDNAAPPMADRAQKEKARADALYAGRRWSLAREAYLEMLSDATGPDREQAAVRIAAADVQMKQYRPAADRLRPLTASGAHQAEALHHMALATRGQGRDDEYAQAVRRLASAHPQSPYAEEALNGIATWLVLRDDDEDAAEVFQQMVRQFPAGRFAERAAWKAGWWAFRQGRMAEATKAFETGAANFPRSDFRPPWLYWSARAKERLGDHAGAVERLVLTATDYHNSYYGRLALARLGEARASVPPSVVESPAARPTPPPTQPQIALLLSLGLYDLALAETQFARRMWGDTPALMATAALVQHRAGRLRPGINAMKRAYPQYLAAGGESLPAEVLRVLFPLDHWTLLESRAKAQGLDPYIVAALAAQESTFDAGIRSSAGAVGLMQIMPATGRGFARKMGIKPFSTGRLTEPEVNVAIGTQYFAELMRQFGGAAYALAGYNAGEHRVIRWRSERPGLPDDEWIDDIPFPETQNYVKRILGTAEDYRRLYGGGILAPLAPATYPVAAPAGKSSRPTVARPLTAKPARKSPPKKKAPVRRPPGT